jgi:hypothetical protein
MRPSRLQTTTAWASSDISAARRFFSSSTEALAVAICSLDVVHQDIALLRQVVGGARQLLHFRRAFRRDPEIAVGPEHQAQLFRHAQQPSTYCLNSLLQDQHADHEAEHGHHRADRQAGNSNGQQIALGLLHVQPDQEEVTMNGPVISRPRTITATRNRYFAFMACIRIEFRACCGRSTATGSDAEHFLDLVDQFLGRERLGHIGIGADGQTLGHSRYRAPWRSA